MEEIAGLKLVKSVVSCAKRASQALQEAVFSEEFKQLKLNMQGGNNGIVESAILGDDFWCKAHLFLQLCEPFV
ncbi:hypothetical protein QYF36_016241 [Acer negundo]|nr:hypothetical protein QYF36_016241 [Acer negundo]